MSSNVKSFLLYAGMVVLVFLIGIILTGKNNSNNNSVTESDTGTSSGSDSMHKPVAADSNIFDNLVGKPAPDFALQSYDGKEYKLSDLKGKNVVLFFNEGLMCYPACWNQIAAFGKDNDLMAKAVILNITADSKDKWNEAIAKMPELKPATVLFDTNRTASNAYGVLKLESSMHRGQFPGHTYVIIDKKGVVRYVKDDVQMALRNKEILDEVNKLSS